MNIHKKIILGLLVFLLISFTILISYGENNIRLKKSLAYLSQLIEHGDYNDLCLTIYYMDPSILTFFPLSVDGLINGGYEQKFIIDGVRLKEYSSLLTQISNDVLIPVEHESSYMDLRIYYVFETKRNGKIFDVSLWGSNGSMFVNGSEVKENDILYDVIIPFLPEEEAEELERIKNNGNRN